MSTSINTEKLEYIEKLGNQISALTRILKMDSGTVLSAETKENLRKMKAEAERLKRKLEKDEFEIAIVGLEKAGKSTFANALMKKCLLPAKDERCTFTQTMIEYSGDGEADSAVVSFYSVAEFNRSFREKLKALEIKDCDKFTYDTLSRSTFDNKLESDSTEAVRKANGDQAEDIRNIIEYQSEISIYLGHADITFSGSEIQQGGELEKFITAVSTAYAVKEVRIRSGALHEMKNAVIFDVPGFNSPTEMHKAQTKLRMKSADAIIVVASGAEPSITGESLKILRESDDDGNLLSNKLFVFSNKTDRAADIPKNIDVTYREWIEKWGFLNSAQKHRIVFGSALWYLESIKEVSSTIATRGIEERKDQMPDGDGIDVIRKRMEEYNRTERFDVLKQRINRLQEELLKAFDPMRSAYGNTDEGALISPEYTKLYGDLVASVPKAAKKKLDHIADDMKKHIIIEKPLSAEIRDYISNHVTVEQYQITDEDIEDERIKTGIIDIIAEAVKIDAALRETKFSRMYGDFSGNIINIANNYHLQYTKDIIRAILSAMDVTEGSQYFDELETSLVELLRPWRGTPEEAGEQTSHQYQSLIERFSRDLYEILIYMPYKVERLQKFYANLENFYSLSVFYRLPQTAEEDRSFLKIKPEEQPLCKMLLYHHYIGFADSLGKLIGDITKITGVDLETVSMLKDDISNALQALSGKAERVFEIVRDSFESAQGKTDQFKLNLLNSTIHEITSEPVPSIADEEAFTRYYHNYHVEICPGQYTPEQLKIDFSDDIQILQDVLLNCFIRAISMEKPFIAREKKSIEDIQAFLETEEFRAYLNRNLRKIKFAESAALDAKERNRRMNENIAREVEGILHTLTEAGENK